MASVTLNTNLRHIQGTNYAFFINKNLGRGYGGEIYQGIQVLGSLPIAVKILNKNPRVQNQISYEEMKKITHRRPQSQKDHLLKQNRLVEIIEIIQLDKTLIIMQLCKCNLKQYLFCKVNIKETQVLGIIKNIVQALIKVQKQGFHFCDLKPQNILITQNNQAKLGDLDSLIKLNNLGQNKKQKFRHQIFGTLHYMPPELLQFGQYGPENYIWTLGVMLHEIIYHKLPFKVAPLPSNPSELEKVFYAGDFYRSLFNLDVCTDQLKNFPKCHFLMKNMLRLNERKRITLERLYDYLLNVEQFSSSKIQNLNTNLQEFSTQNSQTTTDNSLIQDTVQDQSFQLDHIIQRENMLRSQENDQNQKQTKSQSSVSQPLFTAKNQMENIQDQFDVYLMKYFSLFEEILKLMDQIKSPLILVKKLEELKKYLKNILSDHLVQKTKVSIFEPKERLSNLLKTIEKSKAYSHLQKTFKYTTTQQDRQLYAKQLALWQHLNLLLNQLNQL